MSSGTPTGTGAVQAIHLSQQGLQRHRPKLPASPSSPTTRKSGGAPKTRPRAAFATPHRSKPTKAGKYLVLAAASGSDHYKISVDGKQIIEQNQVEGQHPESAIDRSYRRPDRPLSLPIICPASSAIVSASALSNESDMISEDAKKFASAADAVVVSVGFNPTTESEGLDRTFTLPWGQDALIEAIAAANPHTIVTLTGGGGMDTRRWLDKVPALLDTWYPGQEGGTAVADVLFGKHNPEGKLPVSFDRTWEDNPSFKDYYPIQGADTSLHVDRSRPPRSIT